MLIHGVSGFSKYINFYLLLLSLFFIVKIAVLSRKDVVVICAFNSLCVSMLIFLFEI